MKHPPNLYVVPSEPPKRQVPSLQKINRANVYPGDIVAFIACLSFDVRDVAKPFDSLRLAVALRDQLPTLAGRITDEAFMAISLICAELLNDGAESQLADHLAAVAVSKARRECK